MGAWVIDWLASTRTPSLSVSTSSNRECKVRTYKYALHMCLSRRLIAVTELNCSMYVHAASYIWAQTCTCIVRWENTLHLNERKTRTPLFCLFIKIPAEYLCNAYVGIYEQCMRSYVGIRNIRMYECLNERVNWWTLNTIILYFYHILQNMYGTHKYVGIHSQITQPVFKHFPSAI